MKKQLITSFGAVALLILVIAGCSKDNTSGPQDTTAPVGVTNERTSRIQLATSDAFVTNEETTIADQAVEPMDYGTFGKIEAGITPLRWGRFITQVVTTSEDTVTVGDSIAVVRVHKDITGYLKIVGRNGSGDTVTIQKPFNDQSDRNIKFRRVGRNPVKFWWNWAPVAASLVAGRTKSGSITITELRLVSKNDSITITDPLTYFLRYRWLRLGGGIDDDGGDGDRHDRKDVPVFSGGDPITVRVTLQSSSADTDLVALRVGFNLFQRRRGHLNLLSQTLLPSGKYERVFEGKWFAHFHTGFFNMAVDALTRGTLYDDTAPYSVSWWGVPYRLL